MSANPLYGLGREDRGWVYVRSRVCYVVKTSREAASDELVWHCGEGARHVLAPTHDHMR